MSVPRTPPFFAYADLSALLEATGIDVLLVCSRQNIGYITDYTYYVGQGLPTILEDGRAWSRAFAGLPRDETAGAFMTIQHAEEHLVADHDPWILDRRVWGPTFRYDGSGLLQGVQAEAFRSPVEVVVSALRDRGLVAGTIAVELSALPADTFLDLRDRLPDATLVDASPILWKLRLVKSSSELERLRAIASITDAAIGAGYEALDAGCSEIDLRQVMASTMAGLGGEFGWTSVAYGPKGTLNIEPTARVPTRGEVVRIDLVGSYRGYYSDMSRVGSFGQVVDPAVRRAHDAILTTNARMREVAGPGVRCSDLYRIAQESLGRLGYRSLAEASGHGIGRDVGEPPYLTDWDDTVLSPGMVICIEPAMRVPGAGSINIEDMVVISESGNESLTTFAREFLVWPSVR